MLKILLLCVSAILIGYIATTVRAENLDGNYSTIDADETVVFFRTSAWLDEATNEWQVPVHGWIFEPQDSTARKALFASILTSQFGLVPTEDSSANFSRRLNLIIADNERDKRIVIKIAGQTHVMPLSGANGHFNTTLTMPAGSVEEYLEDSVMSYSAVTSENESRQFLGEVMFVSPRGLSVISDIDDTVKISNVTDRRKLLESTFLLDFAAAPGMASLYAKWAERDISFHFVSSSPWQLYTPLQEFLDEHAFPSSELNLKLVRFRDETLFDLFKKGTETKPVLIERILTTYPGRRFILVGDSGEQDPEVYSDMLRKHPDMILKVLIRNVTEEFPDNDRFASLFAGINGDCWQLFDDPAVLTEDLPSL